MILIRGNNKWYRPKCEGCNFFNPECIRGCCYIHDNSRTISKENAEESNTS